MRGRCAMLALVGAVAAGPVRAQALSGPLVVFNAGSLAFPFRELLAAFQRAHPEVQPMQESSGSLEAARKLTELGKIPDLIAVADYGVIAKLLLPRYATWYVTFATNAMVLAYTGSSAAADEITGANWWRILLRPGVRWGSSDPRLDPNGYRALMVFQLAESHYREPGLAVRLRAALSPRLMRPNEAQLTGLLQAGELDYAWSYRSLAETAGLKWVTLPPEIDLSDPTLAGRYAHARVRLPGSRSGADSLDFQGEPIVYALTIPTRAPHPELARAFGRFILSEEGRGILTRAGFRLPPEPIFVGTDRIR
ncbi:MAG TPA: extracellular solute-binding protein [Gemmatimonadales bacterium]|nr:extracellular solute-binding protein [Gemmatimonadales bacterium]